MSFEVFFGLIKCNIYIKYHQAVQIPYDVVHTSGSESISGVKTFNSSPVVPSPNLGDYSNNVVTSKWVKDISTAAVYVSPDGDDSNSGMTAAESVRTLQAAYNKSLSLPHGPGRVKLILAAGEYSGGLVVDQAHEVYLDLQGDITINGDLASYHSSLIYFYTSYSITLVGNLHSIHNSTIFIECKSLTINGQIWGFNSSKIFIYPQISTSITSLNTIAISLVHGSALSIEKPIEISISNTERAIELYNACLMQCGYNITINGNSLTHSAVWVTNSSALIGPTITITGSSIKNGIIVSNNSLARINALITSDVITQQSLWIFNQSICSITGNNSVLYGKSDVVVRADDGSLINFEQGFVSMTATNMSGHIATGNGVILINIPSGKTASLNVNGSCLFSVLSECGGHIRLTGSGTLQINGTYTWHVFRIRDRGYCLISTELTVSGSPTGQRYVIEWNGYLNVGSAGPNRIPGTVAGSVEAGSYSVYM